MTHNRLPKYTFPLFKIQFHFFCALDVMDEGVCLVLFAVTHTYTDTHIGPHSSVLTSLMHKAWLKMCAFISIYDHVKSVSPNARFCVILCCRLRSPCFPGSDTHLRVSTVTWLHTVILYRVSPVIFYVTDSCSLCWDGTPAKSGKELFYRHSAPLYLLHL